MAFTDILRRIWNPFRNKDPTGDYDLGPSYGVRPDRMRFSRGNERSIVTAVYNRIAMDVASIAIKHIRLDENDRYKETINSGINNCLTVEANIDQTGRAFIQDLVSSMLDEGCVAAVPIDTDDEPEESGTFKIYSVRTGKIVEWYPRHIKVDVYNEYTGRRQEIVVPKSTTPIIENPMYSVMNEPNSIYQRLTRKFSLLDVVDEQTSSGKLDLIIQLPYLIKTEARREQAEKRRRDVEKQLSEGKYGIAYTDGTERITQLNRPVENNLMKQIEYLTQLFFSQIGITQSILDGTADEQMTLNYHTKIIEPILSTITGEMSRKWLTVTARSQHQAIAFFRDPFKLVPISNIAEIADKFTRNEILTSNEVRQIIGMKPSKDPNADQLRNKNLSASSQEEAPKTSESTPESDDDSGGEEIE